MDNWQFFLQKEGDYAWLPLETPQVEILEGRYQLIAHTSHAGQSVRVNIRHHFELDGIPQENIQECVKPVEVSGKIEILPLVYLGLGAWSISCALKTEDGSEPSTPFNLDIDVQPQDFDLFEDWNFNDVESSTDETPYIPAESPEPEGLIEESIPALAPMSLMEEMQWNLEEFERATPQSSAPTDPVLPEVDADESEFVEDLAPQAIALELPSFSGEAPPVFFKTVSPQTLPRRISDRDTTDINPDKKPELPRFLQVQSMAFRRESPRERTLLKMKMIAAAIQHKENSAVISTGDMQQKIHDKLNQIAVLNR